jgi:hypothetical protein
MESDEEGGANTYSPPFPLLVLGVVALLGYEKTEALTDNPEPQFQQTVQPSDQAVIEVFGEVMRAHEDAPPNEPTLINPSQAPETMPGCNSEEARSPFLNHKDNQPK